MKPAEANTPPNPVDEGPIVEVTTDHFHRNSFKALQPKQSGHRSGLDALLLAASLPKDGHGIVADFGAGAGVAGFAAINLNRRLRLMSIEKNPHMSELASRSLQLTGNEFLKERTQIIEADITSKGTERLKAGLAPDSVHHGIMNPPYNSPSLRPSPDLLKMEAYMMGEGGIDAWFRTAAAMIKPGGTLSLIYRSENLGEILACTQGRFGGLQIMPIHSRAAETAKRVVVRGTRGSRAPLSLLPGFVVHDDDGNFTARAETIFNGNGYLVFAD